MKRDKDVGDVTKDGEEDDKDDVTTLTAELHDKEEEGMERNEQWQRNNNHATRLNEGQQKEQ